MSVTDAILAIIATAVITATAATVVTLAAMHIVNHATRAREFVLHVIKNAIHAITAMGAMCVTPHAISVIIAMYAMGAITVIIATTAMDVINAMGATTVAMPVIQLRTNVKMRATRAIHAMAVMAATAAMAAMTAIAAILAIHVMDAMHVTLNVMQVVT